MRHPIIARHRRKNPWTAALLSAVLASAGLSACAAIGQQSGASGSSAAAQRGWVHTVNEPNWSDSLYTSVP